MLVDNGNIHMKVLTKEGNKIRCEVLTAGVMGSRRHINLPGVKVNLPPLTEKDLADVAVGAELHVDFVALSFCREPSDVEVLRKVLREHDSTARIVAKIEDQLAVKNIDDIIQTTDVIMVARGDLGIECPMEDLPIIQRRIVKRCLRQRRAGHRGHAHARIDDHQSRADPRGDHRRGQCGLRAGRCDHAQRRNHRGQIPGAMRGGACTRWPSRIERSGGAGFAEEAILEDDRQKTVRSAVSLANSLPDSKIVIFTRRGTMADYVSNLRPNAPIYAFSPTYEVCRKLIINWGTYPHYLAFDANPNRTIGSAINTLVEARPGQIRRPPRHRQRHARRRRALRHDPVARHRLVALQPPLPHPAAWIASATRLPVRVAASWPCGMLS